MCWRERERQIETDSYPWKSSAARQSEKKGTQEKIKEREKERIGIVFSQVSSVLISLSKSDCCTGVCTRECIICDTMEMRNVEGIDGAAQRKLGSNFPFTRDN
ncbi:hypothetical protein QTP88_004267 [Uroleucon formosanum]